MKTIPPSNICFADTVASVPPLNCGRIIKVNAGDTMTLASYQGSEIPYRFLVRLRGVDCPRKRSKSEDERHMASKAQSAMEEMILGSVVYLQDASFDRRGQILARMYTDTNVDLGQWLLAKRLAVPYNGGIRVHPKCWLLYYRTASWDQDRKNVHLIVDMMSKLRTDSFFLIYCTPFVFIS